MKLSTVLVALTLAACDPGIDAIPHGAPLPDAPRCTLPSVGSTCPIPVVGEVAFDAVEDAAWCPAGAELVSDARPGGALELACVPLDQRWRIVVGVVAPGWGVAWLTPDGTLAMCGTGGRVEQLMPLVTDREGRHWHALSADDLLCLADGTCAIASDPCGAGR